MLPDVAQKRGVEVQGAFPCDPYSHTPRRRGAQQPGMTGAVKEEVLARWGELGVQVRAGKLRFAPRLLHLTEFEAGPYRFDYVDVNGRDRSWGCLQTASRSLIALLRSATSLQTSPPWSWSGRPERAN